MHADPSRPLTPAARPTPSRPGGSAGSRPRTASGWGRPGSSRSRPVRADRFRPESDGETARRASRRRRHGLCLVPVLLALIASAGPVAAQTVRIERLLDGPIIRPDMDASMGSNIAGPSLIRVPDWAEGALGRYYLYFADHRGTYIRLAWADALEGPWTTHEPGVLDLADSHFPTTCPPCAPPGAYVHIASPDVHVVDERQEIVMYIHGRDAGRQVTRAAVSRDGLHFEARPEILGRPYFRAFRQGGLWYALAMPARDGLSGFEEGPTLFNPNMRHWPS